MARRADPLTVREKVVSVPNKEKPMGSIVLKFNGNVIRDADQSLSLTDMWKAAGGDKAKQPAKWRDLPSTREFVSHLADVILQKSEDEVFSVVHGGRNPGTWAHWQAAMAYAKYLSPAFHAWCNEVVRAHMQGQGQVQAPAVDGRAMAAMAEQLERLTAEVIELRGHRMLPASLIGKGRAERLVLRRIRELGKMRSDMCGDDYKALRGEIESSARFTINFFGAWGTLPEYRLADVDRYLMTVERDTLRQAQRLHGFGRSGAKPGQLPLPLKLIKK